MSNTFKKEKRKPKDHGRRILQEKIRRGDAEKDIRDVLLAPIKQIHIGRGNRNENS